MAAETLLVLWSGDDADLGLLLDAVESAFAGMEVEAFGSQVTQWLTTASHPVRRRPYLACGFAPMVELLRYLEATVVRMKEDWSAVFARA